MTLHSFLTKHNRAAKAPHTHTWFAKGISTSVPGTLSIPQDRVSDLRKALVTEVLSRDNLDIGPNSITEKVLKDTPFRFFADLDFSIENISTWKTSLGGTDDLFNESLRKTLASIVALYNTVVGKLTQKDVVHSVLTTRLPYKIHLHFPDVIVDTKGAKAIARQFASQFKHDHADLFHDNVTDSSVYTSGLRLLYCHKGCMMKKAKRASELENHEAVFGTGTYCDVYYVTDVNTWEQNKTPSVQDLTLTSIQANDYTALTPLFIPPETRLTHSSKARMPTNVTVANSFASWASTIFGIAEGDIRWQEAARSKDCLTVPTRSLDCPFLKRQHKSNHLYFLIKLNKVVELRCHDSGCTGRNSNICWSAIPVNVQNLLKASTSPVELALDVGGSSSDANGNASQYLTTALNSALQKQGEWSVRKEEGRKNTSRHNVQYTRPMERDCLQQPEYMHEMPGTCSLCVYTQTPERAELVCSQHGHRDITVSNRNVLEIHSTYLQKLEISGKVEVTMKSETCFDKLKTSMIAAGEQGRLMRDTDGSIYRPVEGYTYAYVRHMSAKDWLNDIFLDNPDFSSDCNMIDKLEKTLRDYQFSRFPRFKCDRMYLGFTNGLLRIDTCEFIAKDDVDTQIVARKFFDIEFSPNDLATPLFDSILRHQFDDDVIHLFYVFVGRLFFHVGERDKWQTMMFLFGEAQTGKSTIIRIIMNMFNQVGSIDSQFDQKFGIGGLYEQELIVIDDLPKNIKVCFPQQTWQSMVSGGPVTVRLMKTTPFSVDWKVPHLWGGNWLPNYDDSGQVSRRNIIWRFDNILAQGTGNTNLDTDIVNTELAAIMYKALTAYRDALIDHGSQLLYDWCPDYFKNTRDELRSERNPLFRFLTESPEVSYQEGSRASGEHIRARFAIYLGKQKIGSLDRGTFGQVNPKWTVKTANACKSCGMTTGKGCCDQYKHTQRKGSFEVLNLCVSSICEPESNYD